MFKPRRIIFITDNPIEMVNQKIQLNQRALDCAKLMRRRYEVTLSENSDYALQQELASLS